MNQPIIPTLQNTCVYCRSEIQPLPSGKAMLAAEAARIYPQQSVTTPLQQRYRDMVTPIFLLLFANPKASDWICSYEVDWDTPVALHAVEG